MSCRGQTPTPGRADSLARRVRWLDRYRRAIAVLGAIVLTPMMVGEVATSVGTEWSNIHATFLTIIFGVALWCAIEVGLAWVTAVWETEHSVLSRDRGLPRAIVWTRR